MHALGWAADRPMHAGGRWTAPHGRWDDACVHDGVHGEWSALLTVGWDSACTGAVPTVLRAERERRDERETERERAWVNTSMGALIMWAAGQGRRRSPSPAELCLWLEHAFETLREFGEVSCAAHAPERMQPMPTGRRTPALSHGLSARRVAPCGDLREQRTPSDERAGATSVERRAPGDRRMTARACGVMYDPVRARIGVELWRVVST